jgi:hypothetical protein
VDPEAEMLPATQVAAAADPAADGAVLAAAVVGAADAAAEGALLAPPDEHAASAIVATTESAPSRRAMDAVTMVFLLIGHASGRRGLDSGHSRPV